MKFHHNWLICLNYMLKYLRLSETKNIYIFFYSFLKNYSISASNIFKGSFLPSLRSSNWGSLMYLFFFTKSTKFFKISYTIHVQPNTQTALMYPTIVIQCGCVLTATCRLQDLRAYGPLSIWNQVYNRILSKRFKWIFNANEWSL